ncbi:MAG TPA: hypothetical protein DCG85_04840 [Lachnospiraceae bacterium]|nr:hypothetical protein [Lachnospiraceae bacterium]
MIVFVIVVILAFIASMILLPLVSTQIEQVFSDFIIENTALSGLNKSGELSLFWVITIFGVVLLFLLWKLFPAKKEETPPEYMTGLEAMRSYIPLFCSLLPFLVYLFFFGKICLPLLFLTGISGIGLFMEYKLPYGKARAFSCRFYFMYILTYYAIMSLSTLAAFFIPAFSLSHYGLIIASLLLTVIFCGLTMIGDGDKKLRIIYLFEQILIPLLFFVYLTDRYEYKGEIIKIPFAPMYYVFFILLMGISTVLLILHARKQLHSQSLSGRPVHLVSVITPMLIFAYHSYSACPLYAQPDQHHHGEQMIPWRQIFTLSQTPYKEYTPVSGLFPLFNGGINHIFLRGTVTDYPASISIMMVIICLLTIYLVYKHTDSCFALIIAVMYTLPCYNRQYLVLPSLLLLSLPSLIKKRTLWCISWLSVSLAGGLYYPLFGAAVMIGTLPILIYQVRNMIKEGDIKKDIKKPGYIAAISALLIIIAALSPMLIRMLKHTLTFSSQTVEADGIPLFTQVAPEKFMPWLNTDILKNTLYLSFRFVLPMLGIWFFCLAFHRMSLRIKDFGSDLKEHIPILHIMISGALVLAISYTYTLVRADEGEILSRTSKIFVALITVFLASAIHSFGKGIHDCRRLSLALGVALSIPYAIYSCNGDLKNPGMWVYPDGAAELLLDDDQKLFYSYEVPDNFIRTSELNIGDKYKALIGDGFMVDDQVHYINDYARVIEKVEEVSPGIGFMGLDGLGFYDYLGVKCPASGFTEAARSYEAQREYYDQAMAQDPAIRPVVFSVHPMENYYFFRWMIEDGYIYSKEDNAFFPGELYEKLYASVPDDSLWREDLADVSDNTDFGLSASSFSKSIKSLRPLLSEKGELSIGGPEGVKDSLPELINGSECDVMYVGFNWTKPELSDNCKLIISWKDASGREHEGAIASADITSRQGLLIPIGMNLSWYLSDIDDVNLSIWKSDLSECLYETTYKKLRSEDVSTAYITSLNLYKLR